MSKRIFIAATGAGAGAQELVWQVPGCSSYFAGGIFPYGEDQLEEFIGYRPDKFVHPDVAIEMAMKAYQCAWRGPDDDAIGIGCTAAVATNRIRKGDYVAYVAAVHKNGVLLCKGIFEPREGQEHRARQGWAVDDLIHGIVDDNAAYICADKNVTINDVETGARWLLKNRPYITAHGKKLGQDAFTSQVITPPTDSNEKFCRSLYPGAFNPPHIGHFELAKKTNAVFSLEMEPPHKGQLHITDVLQRLKLLKGHDVLLTAGLPLYLDKSNAFPNHPLVMGADAFIRMLDPKWGPDPIAILNQMSQNNTRIYVFGRHIENKWVSGADAISLVPESATCYDLVPIDDVKVNISSSQIRNSTKGKE